MSQVTIPPTTIERGEDAAAQALGQLPAKLADYRKCQPDNAGLDIVL